MISNNHIEHVTRLQELVLLPIVLGKGKDKGGNSPMGCSAAIGLHVSASVHSSSVKSARISMVVLFVVLLSLFHDFPFVL